MCVQEFLCTLITCYPFFWVTDGALYAADTREDVGCTQTLHCTLEPVLLKGYLRWGFADLLCHASNLRVCHQARPAHGTVP